MVDVDGCGCCVVGTNDDGVSDSVRYGPGGKCSYGREWYVVEFPGVVFVSVVEVCRFCGCGNNSTGGVFANFGCDVVDVYPGCC